MRISISALPWRAAANPTHRRLNRLLGANNQAATRPAHQWLDRVAQATRSLAKLSLPEEGYESSALRRRFMNAGIRGASAPMAYFGLKTALAFGAPLTGFVAVTAMRSPIKGSGLLVVLLLAAALGYYLPNYVLAKAVQRRKACHKESARTRAALRVGPGVTVRLVGGNG